MDKRAGRAGTGRAACPWPVGRTARPARLNIAAPSTVPSPATPGLLLPASRATDNIQDSQPAYLINKPLFQKSP